MMKAQEEENMNLGTLVTLAAVLAVVYICIKYLMDNGLDSCTGDCGGCGPSCKWSRDIKKAQRHMRFQRRMRQFFHLS